MKVRVSFAVLSASRVAATLVPKHRVQKRKNHRRAGNKRQTTSIVDDEEQDIESPSPNLRKLDDMNWKRKAKSFERDVVRGALNSKDEIVSDVGVLARTLQENESTCPVDNVIICEKGIATSIGGAPAPPNTSCKDACDGQCCVDGNVIIVYGGPGCPTGIYTYCGCLEIEYDATGTPISCLSRGCDNNKNIFPFGSQQYCVKPACEGLTATICQDSVTCSGADACTDATVGTIHLGCNGEEACKEAGKDGYLGTINNGCEGRYACKKTGYGGNVTMIQNSCRALASSVTTGKACAYAASNGGKINSIIDSCVSSKDEDASCFYAASNGGYIGDIIKSCNQVAACDRLASDGGYVLGLNDSCNACNICDLVGPSSNPVQFTMDTCCNVPGPSGCSGCSRLGGNDLPAECQIVLPFSTPYPSPASTPSIGTNKTMAPSPITPPPFPDMCASITNKRSCKKSRCKWKKTSHTCHKKSDNSKSGKGGKRGKSSKKLFE